MRHASIACPRRLLPAAVISLALLSPGRPVRAQEPGPGPKPLTRAAVDERMARLAEVLWASANPQGHWDDVNFKAPGRGPVRLQHGGRTALILLALSAAGADQRDPRFVKAFKWLSRQETASTYCLGIRSTLAGTVRDPAARELQAADGRSLLHGFNTHSCMFEYYPPLKAPDKDDGDYSNTNYGVLGVWSAADGGMDVPQRFWQLIEHSYLSAQNDDGGFGYKPRDQKSTGSMTTAALASMFVVWEKLYTQPGFRCRGQADPKLIDAINAALEWLGRNFRPDANPCPSAKGGSTWHLNYYLYNIERVGVASGLKYFGQHDWYRQIATQRIQLGRPGAGDVEEAWELLFLACGRAPVAFHKFAYGPGWNRRPRDLAMLCRQLGDTYERRLNWQILPATVDADEFHDAPLLMMSGQSDFDIPPHHARKVRDFLLSGGTLFAEAIDGSADFTAAFERFCGELFPGGELATLPADAAVYSTHYPLDAAKAGLRGLVRGRRTLILFSPRDVSCHWQRRDEGRDGRASFQLAANLLQLACDGGPLWTKEETFWPVDQGREPAGQVAVGRLAWPTLDDESAWEPTGGWNWRRIDLLSRNGGGPAVYTTPTDLAGPLDPRRTPILHLCGAGAIELTDAAKRNLKSYVTGGGLLLADAVGGSSAFVESFTSLCGELFGPGALRTIPPTDLPASVRSATENGKAWYRHVGRMPRSLRPLEVLGVKLPRATGPAGWNVLFVPCDLSWAMTGAPAAEPVGLEPEPATRFALGLIRSRAAAGK